MYYIWILHSLFINVLNLFSDVGVLLHSFLYVSNLQRGLQQEILPENLQCPGKW